MFGGMTMSQGFFTSVDSSTNGLQELGQRDENIMRTNLIPESTNLATPDQLEVSLKNTGQTKLADYSRWDFIVMYYDQASNYHAVWMPYKESPGNNEWQVKEITLDGGSEIFEKGVLNPGETITLRANIDPSVGGNANMVVVSTPGGVTASTYFSP